MTRLVEGSTAACVMAPVTGSVYDPKAKSVRIPEKSWVTLFDRIMLDGPVMDNVPPAPETVTPAMPAAVSTVFKSAA